MSDLSGSAGAGVSGQFLPLDMTLQLRVQVKLPFACPGILCWEVFERGVWRHSVFCSAFIV